MTNDDTTDLAKRPRAVETTGDTDPWRLAVIAYETEAWARGTIVLHDDLKTAMGLPIMDAARVRGDEFQRARLEYARNVELFKAYLLEEHQVLLVSQHAKGYRLVAVDEHVTVTNRDARDALNSALSDWNARLHNAPVDEMSDAERKELDDSAARLASVRSNMRKELRGMPTRPPAVALPTHEDGGAKN